jgi:hypothetical protein
LIDEWITDRLSIECRNIVANFIYMSSSRKLLKEVFRIFIKVVIFGVKVEGILDQGHFEGIPDLVEEGV